MDEPESTQSQSIPEQMKNMKPEDWANFRKAQMEGELNLTRNGPWYYKLYAIFIIVFVIIFLVFFVAKIIEAYKFEKEFNARWEKDTQLTP